MVCWIWIYLALSGGVAIGFLTAALFHSDANGNA